MRIQSSYAVGLFFTGVALLCSPACDTEVTGGGGSGSGTSSQSASVGGDPISPVQACNDACHKLETMNCTLGGDCMTDCDSRLKNIPTECQDKAANYFNCILLNTTSCDEPVACKDEQEALDTCVATFGCAPDGTCFGGMGMNGEMSCGCEATCKGTKYSTSCATPAGGGMSTCDCLVEGASVGTCQMTDPGGCGPKETCCNTEYFKL